MTPLPMSCTKAAWKRKARGWAAQLAEALGRAGTEGEKEECKVWCVGALS